MIPELTPQELLRFYSKLVLTGCGLRWRGPVNNMGYGRFEFYRAGKRQRVLAHRLACRLWNGTDPGDTKVRHACDTPLCCTPDCLEIGTQADNIHDAVIRGRMNCTGLLIPSRARLASARQRVRLDAKECSKCHEVKPLAAFHRHSGNSDGRQYQCIACRKTGKSERERRGPKRRQAEGVAA